MAEKKTALVTGAASGIGRATCERLAGNGWRVLAVDRNANKLAWADSAAIASCVADVASENDNKRMVAEAERLFGGLNAAVLNAAVPGGGGIDTLHRARESQSRRCRRHPRGNQPLSIVI